MPLETIGAKKRRLEKERDEIIRKIAALEVSDETKVIANALHEALCRYEHTEACAWFYEKHDKEWDWSGWAHDRWIGKAGKFMLACADNDITVEQGLALVQVIKTL